MEKVKKLIFTLVISVLVIVPVITNAETIDVKTAEELFAAVKGNNTVVLQDNITLDKALEVNGNDIILNLNGKTITANKYIDLLKGSLEITGKGTIRDTRELASVGATIYVEGSTNKSDVAYSTLNVGSDVVIETTQWGLAVWDTSKKAYGVTVNFDGRIISSGDKAGGITVQGNIHNDGTIINAPVINLSKTTKVTSTGSDGFPLYGAGAGIWNIVGGTYEGINGALGVKSGCINISGGTFIATAEPGKAEGYGNGINGVGAAIQLESNTGYFGNMIVSIINANITSEKGNSVYHYPAQEGANTLEKLVINGGNFIGDIVFQDNDSVVAKAGTFQTNTIEKYIPKNYKLIKLSDAKYVISNINYLDVEGASATFTVNGVANSYSAIVGQTVKIVTKVDTGYYVKGITVKDENGNTVTVKDDSFVMPEGAVTVALDTARCLDKDANIVEVAKDITVDSSINADLAKELINTTLDNRNSGLAKSIDEEKLQLTDTTTLIEVNFDIKLTKYDEETSKIAYEVKPMYTINGNDYMVIPNNAINGTVKFNLPIPSSVKDTYVKVAHIGDDGKVIDEKEYQIMKNADGEKYVTIETSSFSTFEVTTYYTPKNINPQTGDNIYTYVIMLVGSLLCLSTVCVLKKHTN